MKGYFLSGNILKIFCNQQLIFIQLQWRRTLVHFIVIEQYKYASIKAK